MSVAASLGGKVLVTGAAGFIGSALCARLATRGVPYVAIVRAVPQGDVRNEALVALGDLAAAEWRDVLRGVNVVIHLAGLAHVTKHLSETAYVVANVHVTRRLAEAAAAAKVRRIVFASTVKVYGEASARGRPFRAGDAADPQDAYARTKAAAERTLFDISTDRGIEVVVLRLPLTYGAGVKGNFLTLLEAVAAERRLPLADIDNRRSLLYLGNAVTAFEAALTAPSLAGEILPIADTESIATSDLVLRLARELRVPSHTFHVPAPILRAGAATLRRGAAAARLLDSLEVDGQRFAQLAGWTPPYTLDQGLAETVAWWRRHHTL